jgi:hypothetical protein
MRRLLLLVALAVALGACASSREGSSEREWARAECNRIIDREARHRCLRRVDEDYGGSREEKEPKDGKGRK